MSVIQNTALALLSRARVATRMIAMATMVAMWSFSGAPGAASAPDSSMCDAAAARASAESGVPYRVLMALARTETGRPISGRLSPWPWTVNMEGKGHWFASRTEAQDYARRHYERGARSFDIGCFQINFRWHGSAFSSIEAMFDPLQNARYAAKFLARLHRELGDWSLAAGAYHSRKPEYARRYRTRFDRIHAVIAASPDQIAALDPVEPVPTEGRSLFDGRQPLLSGSEIQPRRHGSLVPITSGRGSLISLPAGS